MSIGMNCISGVPAQSSFYWTDLDMASVSAAAISWAEAGFTVRVVRGWKMRTRQELMNEFAAALQFPYYFGENWAAFDECLSDLEWMSYGKGIVVVVLGGGQVLGECGDELPTFVRMLRKSMCTYSKPIDDGEYWDRPAVPFNVVIQFLEGESDSVAKLWQDAGSRLLRLR